MRIGARIFNHGWTRMNTDKDRRVDGRSRQCGGHVECGGKATAATPLSHAREAHEFAGAIARAKAAWRSSVASRRTPYGLGLAQAQRSFGSSSGPVRAAPYVAPNGAKIFFDRFSTNITLLRSWSTRPKVGLAIHLQFGWTCFCACGAARRRADFGCRASP